MSTQDRWEELVDRYTAELARAVTELQREIATRKQVEEMLFQRNRELILLKVKVNSQTRSETSAGTP